MCYQTRRAAIVGDFKGEGVSSKESTESFFLDGGFIRKNRWSYLPAPPKKKVACSMTG